MLQKQNGKDVLKNALILVEIKKRTDSIYQKLYDLNHNEILLKTNTELLKEVRSI